MLKANGLTAHFGSSQILHGITNDALPGEVTSIMGTIAVGKTMLLKALGGSHPRSGSSITLQDREVPVLPAQGMARQGVEVVPQG